MQALYLKQSTFNEKNFIFHRLVKEKVMFYILYSISERKKLFYWYSKKDFYLRLI
jgi:hypothetical protein